MTDVPGFADFEDEEGAPFFRSTVAAYSTPSDTAAEVLRRLSGVIWNALESASRAPRAIELEDVVGWHRSIFASTFPHEAGQVRTGPTWFGIRWREDGRVRRRMVEGTEPRLIRDEVRTVLLGYNRELRERRPSERRFREALTLAAHVYAELLRIHPFEDGNLRASFPALQTALLSLGAPAVHFDASVEEHDLALGWALQPEPERRTVQPFVDLLEQRITNAFTIGRRDVP